ncbi:Ethylbenzene dehydrogenase, gamma subunit [Aromatoleum aromaticum EbN1]|uniref:Ethylbenzene dehydrogenase, gamma subunit n=1 Tax=Aromatoleum aromaticum (strain DSM 19018 / LMG 30748 / EbN1) TaxID=76114 RepID=Q5NZV0_AROAE|nr:ethylbenzene dehydrogenase subunit gamma [Aromatoleum aromaticum]CAI09414.1 Ethylbenzene dehydrogenase, gamma subunit [Aromatoleum aromaticum EbN1]
MKVKRIDAGDDTLLDLAASVWNDAQAMRLPMAPVPLVLVQDWSPFLAKSEDHGANKSLDVAALHNGKSLAVRLKWASEKHDQMPDLDSFVDGAAVLFPLVEGAPAMTMGAKGKPTNAWFWKANQKSAMEVVAESFTAVQRLEGKATSDLKTVAQHQNGEWQVIFRRSLANRDGLVQLPIGGNGKIAFALWNGGNKERSGRKSFSGDFMDFSIQK